jgi:hypothetical protein
LARGAFLVNAVAMLPLVAEKSGQRLSCTGKRDGEVP